MNTIIKHIFRKKKCIKKQLLHCKKTFHISIQNLEENFSLIVKIDLYISVWTGPYSNSAIIECSYGIVNGFLRKESEQSSNGIRFQI